MTPRWPRLVNKLPPSPPPPLPQALSLFPSLSPSSRSLLPSLSPPPSPFPLPLFSTANRRGRTSRHRVSARALLLLAPSECVMPVDVSGKVCIKWICRKYNQSTNTKGNTFYKRTHSRRERIYMIRKARESVVEKEIRVPIHPSLNLT